MKMKMMHGQEECNKSTSQTELIVFEVQEASEDWEIYVCCGAVYKLKNKEK
jgi:hypothetical protein